MTQKQRFLAAVRGEVPEVVPVAPLIHWRYANKVLGRWDWKAVYEVHRMIGSCHHRGPLGVGLNIRLPDGYGSESRNIEEHPNGKSVTQVLYHTPGRTLRSRTVWGVIPHDPLCSKTIEYPVKDEDDWKAWIDLQETTLEGIQGVSHGTIAEAVEMMGEDGMPSVGLSPAFTMVMAARGMEQFLIDIHDCPDLIDEALKPCREIMVRYVDSFLAAPVDVAWLDICWATGAVMGPKNFERWALPDVVQTMDRVKQVPGKVMGLYTLGRIGKLMPMFVDAGVHFVETFEPNEGDITLAEAKRRYGDRMCLMGNFDCLVLAFGDVDDARREARRCLNEAMEGGGYVMVTADEVPADAKMDNLKAMVETVEEYGRY
ncbi:MAG: hypothetical protein GW893_10810 [Armatimonadetes bacterium]|nr:hypothetical protein [Armatimonadota bacterium]PJB73515.1 MAG: hypothetical protein CO095_05760 [Armatimonadetes bacterium CG_4_9_14_3_um_filter_58_7]